jgi:CRP-like cAMP-binding protein
VGEFSQEQIMKFLSQIPVTDTIAVARGSALLSAGAVGPMWRVSQGVLKLERQGQDGQILVQLAQAGDLIGVETLCAEPYAFTAVALVAAQVQPHVVSHDLDRYTTMAQGFMQQQRQTCDMQRLRTGHISQRLAYLLTLLGRQADGRVRDVPRKDLPTLKEMARVVDSTFETVCRELNHLMPERKPARASLATVWAGGEPFALAA